MDITFTGIIYTLLVVLIQASAAAVGPQSTKSPNTATKALPVTQASSNATTTITAVIIDKTPATTISTPITTTTTPSPIEIGGLENNENATKISNDTGTVSSESPSTTPSALVVSSKPSLSASPVSSNTSTVQSTTNLPTTLSPGDASSKLTGITPSPKTLQTTLKPPASTNATGNGTTEKSGGLTTITAISVESTRPTDNAFPLSIDSSATATNNPTNVQPVTQSPKMSATTVTTASKNSTSVTQLSSGVTVPATMLSTAPLATGGVTVKPNGSTPVLTTQAQTGAVEKSIGYDRELAIIFGSACGIMFIVIIILCVLRKRQIDGQKRFFVGGQDIEIKTSKF